MEKLVDWAIKTVQSYRNPSGKTDDEKSKTRLASTFAKSKFGYGYRPLGQTAREGM